MLSRLSGRRGVGRDEPPPWHFQWKVVQGSRTPHPAPVQHGEESLRSLPRGGDRDTGDFWEESLLVLQDRAEPVQFYGF